MNISLIGMMGSGKTTIAKLLNEQFKNFSFVDTDELIVKKENKTINKIFEENGENYFRNVEKEILKSVLNNDNQIISTGGGIIKDSDNIKLLNENSILIYLKADEMTLYNRVKNNKSRPLLNTDDVLNKIKLLLNEREQSYKKAKFIVDTTNKTKNEVVKEITRIINEYSRS
jgi:shikimate kinase